MFGGYQDEFRLFILVEPVFDRIKSLLSAGEQSVELARWTRSQKLGIVGIVGIHVVLQARIVNHGTKWL